MKVLSIGNSFSTDAHRYLHRLSQANGIDLSSLNLFIGGCDLKTHWVNACENNAFYEYEINGNDPIPSTSILQALEQDKWDIITFQQASPYSGLPETIMPYITQLADFVRNRQPQARFYYHQTWAYEIDSQHPGFVNYNYDQQAMFQNIKKAASQAAESIGADIIPTGETIQLLREKTAEFDYVNGGLSLCRDGFHLSFDYGRFSAAAIWLHTLTGIAVKAESFEGLRPELIKTVLDTVNMI